MVKDSRVQRFHRDFKKSVRLSRWFEKIPRRAYEIQAVADPSDSTYLLCMLRAGDLTKAGKNGPSLAARIHWSLNIWSLITKIFVTHLCYKVLDEYIHWLFFCNGYQAGPGRKLQTVSCSLSPPVSGARNSTQRVQMSPRQITWSHCGFKGARYMYKCLQMLFFQTKIIGYPFTTTTQIRPPNWSLILSNVVWSEEEQTS